ncbi:MAG: pilus assembly protein PilP [Gallionellaceae bacterium]
MMRLFPLLITVALLLSACGNEEFQDLHDFVKNSGADMRGEAEPPPQMKPYVPFNFDNSAGLPNPFNARKPDIKSNSLAGLNQPDMKRRREPLEDFPLDGMMMIGYLSQGNIGQAIIRTPDQKNHRVKAGNYLGQNFGHVIEVTETDVTIKEMVQDSAGDWSERMSSLQLVE